eukprot:CCRYP_019307-RB/>CCRYP_019307-RB protein AED:0.04 eAED:0.04 QI:115/1/1/1/1/1/2/412/298
MPNNFYNHKQVHISTEPTSMSTHNQRVTAAESRVKNYLDSFANTDHPTREQSFPRVVCCKTSQSLYCKECCRLLVPDDALPLPINLRRNYACNDETVKNSKSRSRSTERKSHVLGHGEKQSWDILDERPLRLPFDLHLILDDRRGSSTGLHAVALLDISRDKISLGDDGGIGTQYKNCQHSCGDFEAVTLTDVEKLDVLEQSEVLNHAMNFYVESNRGEGGASTYFLFPCPGESVPLESVSNQVKTLVVLDCKWTKSGVWRRSEKLRQLPKVGALNESYLSLLSLLHQGIYMLHDRFI